MNDPILSTENVKIGLVLFKTKRGLSFIVWKKVFMIFFAQKVVDFYKNFVCFFGRAIMAFLAEKSESLSQI